MRWKRVCLHILMTYREGILIVFSILQFGMKKYLLPDMQIGLPNYFNL